jgi:ubiquinone/menaquinone biosynthesis C-methylase UbiE
LRKIFVVMQAVATRFITLVVYRAMPSLRLGVTRFQYNLAAKMYPHKDYKFINCGFAEATTQTSVDFNRPENLYLLWEKLYQQVAGRVTLHSKDVLEVGCGRGGGSEFMMKNLKPKSLVAMDLSDIAISRCKDSYQLDGLTFQIGNACALPFDGARFDAVVNVESSHCYPSQKTFFEEVFRVLKPGGHFCYADITESAAHTSEIKQLLAGLGFQLVEEGDITANVVASLEIMRDTPQFADAFTRWESQSKKNNMKIPMMVIKNTLSDLTSGKQYQRWIVRKPASPN